jgi:broad specificity phosphatase PhoE
VEEYPAESLNINSGSLSLENLILVKHSLPEIISTLPAPLWHLSEIGRLRCKTLAEKVAHYSPDCIVSSSEPKAIETAQIAANHLHQTFQVMAGLHEHDRRNVGWESKEKFEAQVAEFFRRPQSLVMGQETASQAYERFAQAVAAVIKAHPSDNIAIVAHGTVITLWVAQVVGLEPFGFWQRLGLPSFVVLSLPKMDLVTVVENIKE